MRAKSSIYKARAEAEIAKIYLRQLPMICLVIAGYYFFITINHFFFLTPDLLIPVAGTSALATLTALIVLIMVKRGLLSARKSHKAFIPVALTVGVTVYSHILLSNDQIQLTNAILTQFACALMILSPWVFTLVLGIYSGAYLAALATLPGPYTIHFAFMYIAAMAVTVLGYGLRYRALYRSERLLLVSRGKSKRLARAAKKIHRKMVEAQEANAARDIFLANVTHELRTPLTGVMGMLDLVKEGNLDEDQEYLVGNAHKSAAYLLNIVNDLLDFAKLEAGKVELNPRPFDPQDITETATETFRASAEAKDIELTLKCTKPMPEVLVGDSVRISQVLLNLINNAVKFTEAGNVEVVFTYADGKASWSIKDTGPGIPAENLAKLFERFEQLDTSATRSSSGTGLGLAIVDELVSLMDGSIQVDSKVGHGTVFLVTIPLTTETTEPSNTHPESATEELPAPEAPFQHLNLKALVAEDNEINQVLISRILEKLGVQFELVENGERAVEAATAAGQSYDLIFMDVQMPLLDGVAATKAIRSAGVQTPIVAITANTMESDIEEYKAAGMAHFVGKPINFDRLKNVIAELTE